eukprot:scaffold1690_cov182-Amphora_coffeaeformis.AAC.68
MKKGDFAKVKNQLFLVQCSRIIRLIEFPALLARVSLLGGASLTSVFNRYLGTQRSERADDVRILKQNTVGLTLEDEARAKSVSTET